MKGTYPISLTALVIVFLTLVSFAPAYAAAAENNATLSKKELKALLKTARTPYEHRTIGAYYRQEAQRLTDSSRQHAELAATYEKNPPFTALETKHGFAFGQGVSHCRRWAKLDAEQAEKATKLAALHDEMAQKAEAPSSDPDGVANATEDAHSTHPYCLRSSNSEKEKQLAVVRQNNNRR
jgi:hypothetical protein